MAQSTWKLLAAYSWSCSIFFDLIYNVKKYFLFLQTSFIALGSGKGDMCIGGLGEVDGPDAT